MSEMTFIQCNQGTTEWLQARAGLITASRFAEAVSRVGGLTEQQAMYVNAIQRGRSADEACQIACYKAAPRAAVVAKALLGEDTSEPSDIAKRYAADLALERISGYPHGEPPKAWVLQRGHEMEAIARRLYEGRPGQEAFVSEAGICVKGSFGYSSDGLVEEDGLIEIKAPIDSIKIAHVWETGDVSEYVHQMQGGMWITGRKWCDFILYVPELEPVGKDLYVKRIERDEAFITNMAARLEQFEQLVAHYERIFRKQAA